MKKIKLLSLASLALALAFSITSCKSTDDNTNEVTLTLNATNIEYNESGVWAKVYDNSAHIVSQNIVFSHTASISQGYSMWNGFSASRNSDTKDYSSTEWITHQWGVMSGGGLSGVGTPFMVGFWDNMEPDDVKIEEASCVISYGGLNRADAFTPLSVYINNSTYAYYCMLNGSAYNKKFGKGDYCKLKIYGYLDGVRVSSIDFYLADYRSEKEAEWTMIKDWTYVNLEALGKVEYICFQMESSDSGNWGMNNPAYFCLDRLKIKL